MTPRIIALTTFASIAFTSFDLPLCPVRIKREACQIKTAAIDSQIFRLSDFGLLEVKRYQRKEKDPDIPKLLEEIIKKEHIYLC